MLVGIDVGGTFTDGVVLDNGEIVRWCKRPTNTKRLQDTIEVVIDDLLTEGSGQEVERIVLSTTLITNLLATGQLEKAALVVIPGPGLNPYELRLADNYFVLQGGIDFRGREIAPVSRSEVRETARVIKRAGIKKVAVVGKFSQRNPSQEEQVASILYNEYSDLDILMGHQISGELNFPRRAITTYYTLITRDHWSHFADEIEKVLRARGILVPIEIMKADGGTMSLDASRHMPCQTAFSGPAASTMGAFALTMDDMTSVVVDIGGTTTDLSFILQGEPLHASKGAKLGGRYTHVKALAVRSVALGGDSVVRLQGGKLTIGPDRQGDAACFGGPVPTPTDAFNLLEGGKLGDVDLSYRAVASLVEDETKVADLAEAVVQEFIDILCQNIREMMRSWEQEPAYRVWEIVNRRRVKLERVVGIGAPASAVIPRLASRMGCQGFVNRLSTVGNALGAVVARPTLQITLHADTQTGTYSTDGKVKKLPDLSRIQMRDIKELGEKELRVLTEEKGMADYFCEREFFLEEQFNVIRGWSTSGRIFDVGITISPGVIKGFKGVKT
ncbi:MAG: hydantoinase/oxoprolinase family protein [Syntrophomonadales bacterium]|jgi:N-methylhydantoinase A/oxoprolinase/acetone carboxylase beta subunit